MRLWIFSDLHLEPDEFRQPPLTKWPDADVCVVAGDLYSPCDAAIDWLGVNVAPAMPVVVVAGNHEFYGDSIGAGFVRGRRAAKAWPGIHFLENEAIVIGGVRFLGATLWTDYALHGGGQHERAWSMMAAESAMNDHRAIRWRHDGEPFTAGRALELHEASRSYLRSALAEPHDGPTVVVTHHAPHPGSIHPRFAGSALNAAFVSDLTTLIQGGRPDLWVHGHVHDTFDYRVPPTRIVANPRGYGTENPAFDPALVVDL